MKKKISRGRKMIEGLPASYDVTYVTKNKKKCPLCNNKITESEINDGLIIYVDRYDFSHKDCLDANSIQYKHLRENDYNSPVSLVKRAR